MVVISIRTSQMVDIMAKIQEIYVRTTRDELGRYPTWPIQQPIALGNIGFYNGRQAEFSWVTSLSALGITIAPSPSQSLIDEMYTTMGAVNLKFEAAASGSHHQAGFTFSKPLAVATQGYKTSYAVLPLGPLEQAVVTAIRSRKASWNMDWVIVTELWQAEAFTTLISGAKESSAHIATNGAVPGGVFNIADITVGVKLAKSEAMGYNGVAEKGVNPFFQIHRLVHEKKNDRYYLKRYGRNTFSFWPKK